MNMIESHAVWVVVLLACAQATSASESVDVYLFGGQSNMQGVGRLENLPEDVLGPVPNFFYWSKNGFVPLVIGKTPTSKPGRLGPELGFALGMSPSKRPVYLVKVAFSGKPLHHGWSGPKWVGGEPEPKRVNFHPGKTASDANIGSLYRSMLKRYEGAIAALKKEGKDPHIKGFVWMQGEQDSKNVESAEQYPESLKRLRNRLSEDLGLATPLPLTFGQVLPLATGPKASRFVERKLLRRRMAEVDERSGHADAAKGIRMVSTDTFDMMDDHVHFSATGLLQLGRGFARAMKSMRSSRE